MKIAFSLFRFFPFGGLQRDMLAIGAELVSRGHDVTIFTRDWQGEMPAHMTVQTLPNRAISNHAADARFARSVRSYWRDFDVCVGFNKMAGLDFYYAADGCIAATAGRGPKYWLPRYRTRLAMEESVFAPQAQTRILSISPPQKALYQQVYGTDESRFVDLPPGIRRDRQMPADYPARRAAHRSALGLVEGARLLLFVGSGFRTQGLDRALVAAAAVMGKDDRFVVVGADRDGPYQRQAAAAGIAAQVMFVGGQDNIPEWLWAGDLLLHPAYAENTGTVLLEAAIAGMPVLTTSACGYAPYIHSSGMGSVIDAGDVSDQQLEDHARALLRVPRESWLPKARAFADHADIYSLVAHAADAILEDRP